ncbi:MAG: DUF1707 domain-containing protein [Solirubrobacterales bacterium]|nr:DUF1707 domain-containing protein [Solirubrobacterales bacterium]
MPHDASTSDLGLRVSDADREAAVQTLRVHATAGRLQVDELEQRVERSYRARTRSDLLALTRDLPPLSRPAVTSTAGPRGRSRERTELARHATTYAAVMVMLVAIWALTGAGYFWPVWPMLGWGIGVGSEAVAVLGGRGGVGRGGCARAGSYARP